jgi:3-oxoacyl-[acyl-carrier protein] reductase
LNILITGTSRGIGYELAKLFLLSGHKVFGISRSASNINSEHYEHFIADLRSHDQLKEVIGKLGEIDVLINNAAIASMNSFVLSDIDTLEDILQVNLVSAYYLSREISKKMILQKFGRIINISTVGTLLNIPGEIQYLISKSALEKFTVLASNELSSYNITVNAIRITLYNSNLLKGVSLEQMENIKSSLVQSDFLNMEDLIYVINFLIDKRASKLTGQFINFGGVAS